MGRRRRVLTGIPDLQADDSVRVGVDDALGHEAGADGGRDLGGVEGALAVSHDEGSLAHALGAEDDDLGLQGRHGSIACLLACLLACLVACLFGLPCLALSPCLARERWEGVFAGNVFSFRSRRWVTGRAHSSRTGGTQGGERERAFACSRGLSHGSSSSPPL